LYAVLDERLQNKRLFHCAMKLPKTCLCGCVQFLLGSYLCKSSVYNRHEKFGEWWVYGDATVVIWVSCASFVFENWYDFGLSP
jgi:hypothetical protein